MRLRLFPEHSLRLGGNRTMGPDGSSGGCLLRLFPGPMRLLLRPGGLLLRLSALCFRHLQHVTCTFHVLL